MSALPRAETTTAASPPVHAPAGAAPQPLRSARRPGFVPESRLHAADAVRRALRRGRSVFVVGPAGVGKTHVVGRVLDELADDGEGGPVVVAVSGGTTRGGIPLAALEPLLGDDGLLTMGSFARTVRVLAASVAERAAGRPVVLRVEDAHLLDDASAQALAWVVRQGEVLLVATSRRTGASGSPWLELWKDDVVERVDVEPFTPADVEQWLAAELGGRTTVDTARRIWSETRGNVFYARELVRAELAAGSLRERGGVWVWTGRAAPGPRLLEVVENDTARLSEDGRRGLEVVALLGPAPLSHILDLVPRAALDELARAGIVTVRAQLADAGGNDLVVDMVHALYADAVRTTVPRRRRRELLAATPGSAHPVAGPPLLRSVEQALDVGLPVPHERLRAAVDAAFGLQQGDSVVRLVDAGLRDAPRGAGAWTELMVQRAEAWWYLGEAARAERDAREAAAVVRAEPAPSEAAVGHLVAAVQIIAAAVHDRDDVEAAVAVLDEVHAWLVEHAAPGPWEGALMLARLVRYGAGGRYQTMDLAISALADPGAPSLRVALVSPTVIALAHAGRFRTALHLCRRYLPVALAHSDEHRRAPAEITVAMLVARLWCGDIEALAASVERELDVDGQVVVDWAAVQAGRGLLAMARGAWSHAAADLGAANTRPDDRGAVCVYTLAVEALARAASGDAAGARRLLDQVDATPLGSSAAFEPEVRLLRLDTRAWLGEPGLGDEATALALWARERGLARVELEALHRCVRAGGVGGVCGAGGGVPERVAQLAAVVEGPRAAAVAAHVAALATGDADLSRIAERELNRRGLWPAPSAPAIDLTPREREIAALAAGGMTSRAIAQRLILSVRTVDSHLARVFAKTGVHSREGLSAVLR